MSVTQTYYLAHKARAKLSSEAGRSDHDLRLLVGHANLLDSLMVELAEAEREQDHWFNQSVRASHDAAEPAREELPETTVYPVDVSESEEEEEEEEDSDDEYYDDDDEQRYEGEAEDDSEDDSEEDSLDSDEDVEMADAVSVRRVTYVHHGRERSCRRPSVTGAADAHDDGVAVDDDDDDYGDLGLARMPSHHALNPPELDHDADTSEDEPMPPSPHQASLPYHEVAVGAGVAVPGPAVDDVVLVDAELAELDQQEQQEQKEQRPPRPQEPTPLYASDAYYVPPKNPARLFPHGLETC